MSMCAASLPHTCDREATDMSEAECCKPFVLDLTAAPCGPKFDLGVVGMLVLCCHAGASKGCRCPALLDEYCNDGDVLADADMLTGGGGIAEQQAQRIESSESSCIKLCEGSW